MFLVYKIRTTVVKARWKTSINLKIISVFQNFVFCLRGVFHTPCLKVAVTSPQPYF